MSATLNPDKLCSYYYWPFYPLGPPQPQASYFEIQGQMNHHVPVFYLDEILEDRKIRKCHANSRILSLCINYHNFIFHR